MNREEKLKQAIELYYPATSKFAPDIVKLRSEQRIIGMYEALQDPSILRHADPEIMKAAGWQSNEWISVGDRLPEKPKNKQYQLVQFGHFTDKGNFVQFIGFYAEPHSVEYGDDDYDGDYDEVEERNGTLYLKPGWYEEEEQASGSYDYCFIPRICTHWKPLPQPPKP